MLDGHGSLNSLLSELLIALAVISYLYHSQKLTLFTVYTVLWGALCLFSSIKMCVAFLVTKPQRKCTDRAFI